MLWSKLWANNAREGPEPHADPLISKILRGVVHQIRTYSPVC